MALVRATRESTIEQHLRNRIARIGGECYKFVSPGRIGVPDRIVILPGGEVVWVEVKASKGVLSPAQIRCHARLKELMQAVKVLWSVEQVNRYFPLEESDDDAGY